MKLNNDISNVTVSAIEPVGKNKVWLQHSSKNILQCKKTITSSVSDVTITSDYTGQALNYINVTKSSSTSGNIFIEVASFIFEYATGNYILNGCPGGGSSDSYQLYFRNITTNTDVSPRDEGSGANVSLIKGNQYSLYIRINSTAIFSNKKFYPMLRLPTETDGTYEPYVQDKEHILNSNNTYEEFNPQNEVYSLNETIIGTWIDGKPLYRKTFETTSITTSNTNFITNLGNITPRRIYGILETTYSTKFPMPLTDSSSNYNVIFYTPDDNGSIRGRAVVGSGAFSKAYITIEYTKITD